MVLANSMSPRSCRERRKLGRKLICFAVFLSFTTTMSVKKFRVDHTVHAYIVETKEENSKLPIKNVGKIASSEHLY
jgi:hypothetical protein